MPSSPLVPSHCWAIGGWRLELLGLSQDQGFRHVITLVGGGETWGCSRLAHHRVMWVTIQCLLESDIESAFVLNILGICWNFRNKERKLALSGWISLFRSWGWTLLKAPCLQSESDAGWWGSDGVGWPLRPYPPPLPRTEVCCLWHAFISRCDPHFLSLRQSANCFGGENSSRNTQLQAVFPKSSGASIPTQKHMWLHHLILANDNWVKE